MVYSLIYVYKYKKCHLLFSSGFQTYFTIQGLRCLDPGMFLQYVDYGVLRLTEEFVSRLMHEVSDNDQDMVNMKIEIVSRLPKVGFE